MSNEIAQRQEQLKPHLMGIQRQIQSLLADETKAKRFMAASLVVASNQNLAKCSPESIAQALVGVALSDLNIDPNIGHCYLVPYKGSVQLQVGYKGFIQILYRAGWLVKGFPVYNCDDFSMSFNGWDNKVSFNPNIDARDEGDRDWVYNNLRGVYAIARNADTHDEYSLFVSKSSIDKLRKVSPNQRATEWTKPAEKKRLDAGLPVGIWHDWYSEMACAKAIKKLAKTLPIGDARATMAIAIDDHQEIGNTVDIQKSITSGVVTVSDEQEPQKESIVDRILKCENMEQLNELLGDIESSSASEKKLARKAWKTQIERFAINEVSTDWKTELKECGDKGSLEILLGKMPESVQIELADDIDALFDSFN